MNTNTHMVLLWDISSGEVMGSLAEVEQSPPLLEFLSRGPVVGAVVPARKLGAAAHRLDDRHQVPRWQQRRSVLQLQ